MEDITINVPGEFNEIEEAILEFLYEHPDWDTGTFSLVKTLRGEPSGSTDEEKHQQAKRAFEDVQHAVETLIMGKLAKGKRLRAASGEIYFSELKLTPSGEAAAIKQKRRLKKIVNNLPRPKRA
jgi:hypothetical protein